MMQRKADARQNQTTTRPDERTQPPIDEPPPVEFLETRVDDAVKDRERGELGRRVEAEPQQLGLHRPRGFGKEPARDQPIDRWQDNRRADDESARESIQPNSGSELGRAAFTLGDCLPAKVRQDDELNRLANGIHRLLS